MYAPLFRTRRRTRTLLACLAALAGAAVGMPEAFPAPPAPVESPAAGRRFLDHLAQAERNHDYRSILAEADRQVAARPEDFEGYRRRALARWGARQYDGALEDFQRAIALADRQKARPRVLAVLYYGRALVHREQHHTAAEAAELEHASRADRNFTDALNDLAWIRATNPDDALRNGRQAVGLARRACAVVPGSVKYLDTLAAAYAETGDAKRAVAAENDAVKAAKASPRAEAQHQEFLEGAGGRIESYGRGEHCREDPHRAAAAPGPEAAAGTQG